MPEFDTARDELIAAALSWRQNPGAALSTNDDRLIEAVDAFLAVSNRSVTLPTYEPKPYPGVWARLREHLDELPVEPAVADEPDLMPGEQRLAGAVQHAQAEQVHAETIADMPLCRAWSRPWPIVPYLCNEPAGHVGYHRVRLGGELLASWPQRAAS